LWPDEEGKPRSGILINLATGIAGAVIFRGRVLLSHPSLGAAYGQFGRFLIFDLQTRKWDWRPTTDGSVPVHSSREVRWTRYSAGPALARRIADWCVEHRIEFEEPSVRASLDYFRRGSSERHIVHEATVLRLSNTPAYYSPDGPLAPLARHLVRELASALRRLLEVFP